MKEEIKKIVSDVEFYNVCKRISNEEHFDIYINIEEGELFGSRFDGVRIVFNGTLTDDTLAELTTIVCHHAHLMLMYQSAVLTDLYSNEEIKKLKDVGIIVSF